MGVGCVTEWLPHERGCVLGDDSSVPFTTSMDVVDRMNPSSFVPCDVSHVRVFIIITLTLESQDRSSVKFGIFLCATLHLATESRTRAALFAPSQVVSVVVFGGVMWFVTS